MEADDAAGTADDAASTTLPAVALSLVYDVRNVCMHACVCICMCCYFVKGARHWNLVKYSIKGLEPEATKEVLQQALGAMEPLPAATDRRLMKSLDLPADKPFV